MPAQAPEATPLTLPFEQFWSWLKSHRNCILRVGTPYSVMMDHEDYHWDTVEEGDTQILQLVRGKELVGEIMVLATEIAYVHCAPSETEEQLFECVVETPEAREVMYHFVMAHSYDGESDSPGNRWTH